MSEEKAEVQAGPSSDVTVESVLRVIADWEQDYFVPISLPPHTKAHIDTALAQLRERIKGLSP